MKSLLDSRNINLWNKINSNYKVNFEKSSNSAYGCYTQGKEVTFYIGTGELSKDYFTHEMLHVYFRLNDCFFGEGLSNVILYNNRLGILISGELIEHVGNCFEHVKMFPLYLEMGFEQSKFLTDYHEYKCKPSELQIFKDQYLREGRVNINLVDPFIGRLVAMLCDPNTEFEYNAELEEFKKLDSLLFLTIKTALDFWVSIDVESKDIIFPNYHDLIFSLENDLEKWYQEKI